MHTTGFKSIIVHRRFPASARPGVQAEPQPHHGFQLYTHLKAGTPPQPRPRPVQAPPPPCPSVQRAALEPGPRCKSSVTRRGWPAGTNGGSRPVLGLRPWGNRSSAWGRAELRAPPRPSCPLRTHPQPACLPPLRGGRAQLAELPEADVKLEQTLAHLWGHRAAHCRRRVVLHPLGHL